MKIIVYKPKWQDCNGAYYDVYVIIIIEMQIKSNIFVYFCWKQNSAIGMVVKLISHSVIK